MEFVDHLKQSVDIVGVIGEYVRLRKSGQRYTGLCPFHNERTPSFSVNPQHQFFKCFGCGESGDVLSFVMKQEGVTFFEALKLLAERNGIPMPKRTGVADEESKQRGAMHRMHELAEREFRKLLHSDTGAESRRYLSNRGVSNEAIERFGLGYSPRNNGVVKLLQAEGFGADDLRRSGLAIERDDGTFFDRFRDRLMFPIHNESGKPIGFGGRALSANDNPKYLNSPETSIYKKSAVLYNMHRAKDAIRKLERVVLVEGYMDAIGAASAGVNEVIASCGTSLTSQQVLALRRHAPQVIVNYDGDNAGASASEKSVQLLLAEGLRVRVLMLEGGLDPDEYCRKHGAEAYQGHIETAPGYFHWLADRARSKFDMKSAEGRYEAFQFLLPSIGALSDKLQRVAVANDLASYLGVNAGLVLENFRKMAAEPKKAAAVRPVTESLRHADKILLRVLLEDSDNRDELLDYLRRLPSHGTGRAAKLYEGVLAICDIGSTLTYAALHARLSPEDQTLLADALLRDENESRAPSMEDAVACLEALVEEERERERGELKTKIREAERNGSLAEALRLAEELNRLR